MLRHYVLLALRHARREPPAAVLNVFTLSLGLACFVTASAIIGFWDRADARMATADRAFLVTSALSAPTADEPPRMRPVSTHYVAQYLKTDFPKLEEVARAIPVNDNASYVAGDRSIRIREYSADPDLPAILDLPFVAGDRRTALAAPRSVVLTEQTATQLFGDEPALGKHVLLGALWDATVTGVVRNIEEPSHMGRSATAPFPWDALSSRDLYESVLRTRFGSDTSTGPENWANGGNFTYVLLPKDGSLTAEQLRAQLPAFVQRHVPVDQQERMKLTLDLLPVPRILAKSTEGLFPNAGVSLAAILWTLGALVLVVACVNYANLAIGRSAFRARAVGVRKAIGAGVLHIAAQSLVESALLTMAALAMALVFVALLAPALTAAIGIDVRLALLADVRAWAGTLAIVTAVTLLSGSLPAIALARIPPVFALHGGAARLRPRLVSTVLVGTQFFVTSFLLIAVAVSYLQNRALERTGLGATAEPLLVIENYAALTGLSHERMHDELLRLPGVRAETAAAAPPWISASGVGLARSQDASAAARFALVYDVADEFFSTYEIPVLAGRTLAAARGDLPGDGGLRVAIDRGLAAMLGFERPEDAVGQVIYDTTPKRGALEIVGVVENRQLNVSSFGGPTSNMYVLDADPTFHVVRLASSDLAGTLRDIDALWKRLVPNMAPNRRFLDEYFEESFEEFVRINQAFVGLALFALSIAAMGLFAMALFVVARRAREIAIRKVLGARSRSIVSLLLRGFAPPVLMATVLAWPVAYLAAGAYLSQFAAPIRLSPTPFLMCFAFTAVTALVAVGGQTWRAARPAPAGVLRAE
jgi:putative ABC transport system permease protein